MKKVVFMGYGEIGKKCIELLVDNGFSVELILTHIDRTKNGVDTYAISEGIEFSYVDSRTCLSYMVEKIKNIKPDYLVSINYRYIIPKPVFELAEYAINIHGSLLPKYRGRAPHVWSIINGEVETGVTCHFIDERVDSGDIIVQKSLRIENEDTGYTLLEKFKNIYPNVLSEALLNIETVKKYYKQDEGLASYYGKRTPILGYIDFRKSSIEVINFVRAQAHPYPGAYYFLPDGRKIIINKVSVFEAGNLNLEIGTIKTFDEKLIVKCKDSILKIDSYTVLS